ncbi:MAG: hypothetical protein HYR91_02350 [Flavobacteriia bacterium]|nr:hypothetical protein [Flavobacteriia bacterium]
MGAWFTMWMVIGIIVIWSAFTFILKEQEQIILFVFFIFWCYYALKVGRSFFWILWGKELIKINETSLTYKKSIRNYGQAIPYYLENIKKINTYIPKDKSLQSVWETSPWVKGGERIEFQYMGKTVRFARKLEENETKLLFNLITRKIDEKIRKLK